MIHDTKKALEMIMKKRKGMTSEPRVAVEIESSHDVDAKKMAAEEILMALKSESAEDLKNALCNFLDLYESEPHEEYSDTDDEY